MRLQTLRGYEETWKHLVEASPGGAMDERGSGDAAAAEILEDQYFTGKTYPSGGFAYTAITWHRPRWFDQGKGLPRFAVSAPTRN